MNLPAGRKGNFLSQFLIRTDHRGRAMTVEAGSETRRRAAELSEDGRALEGPLKGYHHETYAFPLPAENRLSARFARGKLRDPRPGLFWFDRRCFLSEDRLLIALRGRISRIPECVEVAHNVCLQGFIEGRTLGSRARFGRPLSDRHVRQLGQLFEELAAIKSDEIDIRRICTERYRSRDGDSADFLLGLIRFTEEEVCRTHADRFGGLFRELGVCDDALKGLKTATRALRSARSPSSTATSTGRTASSMLPETCGPSTGSSP
ncbi:hypothetical protein ACFYW6_11860 [Streptomyces sp. NPDC002659]|uniref:hypothetical protein n=1 Tax=Streptomyces sp. NPDC002659 TaxID=3364656 RepID=UPI00367F0430